MNDTLQLLLNRRSYRNFDTNVKLSESELELIIKASKQAPTSMNLQLYSIIVIDDENIKQQIYQSLKYNPQIKDCSHFLIYCIDYTKSQLTAQHYVENFDINDNVDTLLLGSIDASLAMQNAIIACEALNYKSVCIGGVKNMIDILKPLLNLPDYVFPLCGLCIGKTIDEKANLVKPRLNNNVHYNSYQITNMDEILAYDEIMKNFAQQRETEIWSKKASKVTKVLNKQIRDDLLKQKF